MFRYKLRTLLIVLALAPPFLAAGWIAYCRFSTPAVEHFEIGSTPLLPTVCWPEQP